MPSVFVILGKHTTSRADRQRSLPAVISWCEVISWWKLFRRRIPRHRHAFAGEVSQAFNGKNLMTNSKEPYFDKNSASMSNRKVCPMTKMAAESLKGFSYLTKAYACCAAKNIPLWKVRSKWCASSNLRTYFYSSSVPSRKDGKLVHRSDTSETQQRAETGNAIQWYSYYNYCFIACFFESHRRRHQSGRFSHFLYFLVYRDFV